MKSFVDEKDKGELILTHIYLLFGCSVPMWLFLDFSGNPLFAHYSGLLIIGVGDAMVCLFISGY